MTENSSYRSLDNSFPLRNFFIYKIGKTIILWLENIISNYSLIENNCFVDPYSFCWVSNLENNWQEIKRELDIILKSVEQLPSFHDISQDQYSLSHDNHWKTYFLYGYGIKMHKNCQYFPVTTQLIEKIPGMRTAFFSILLPGKHIPEHRGPYKGVIRYHLPLKVPSERKKCCIRVGNEFAHWVEGKSLMFDDSFYHEAWNLTDEIRVVLFMDIVRPCKFPVSWLNNLVIFLIRWSPFIQDARRNQVKWDPKIKKILKS